jgi:hypothetical protein
MAGWRALSWPDASMADTLAAPDILLLLVLRAGTQGTWGQAGIVAGGEGAWF